MPSLRYAGMCGFFLLFGCFGVCFASTAPAGEKLYSLSIWESPLTEPFDAPLPHALPGAPKGGELRSLAVGSFDSLNPFSPRGLPAARLNLTYETLASHGTEDDFTMHGLLAESFELAPDRSWLVAHLRPEAKFQDGAPVTAEDVAFTFNALMEQGSPVYKNYYARVKSAEVLAPRSVRFHFAESGNRELPLIITQMPVLPKHWWQGKSLAEPQHEAMPGSGPYRVAAVRMGSSIEYERDPGWWGAALPRNAGLYNFGRIRVDYYRSQAVAREAFLAGEADFFVENTIKDWVSAYDTPAVRGGQIRKAEIAQDKPAGMSGFFFNTRRAVFSDIRVRKAISLAFDFEWTNKTLFHGAYTRCDSYFSNSPFAARGLPSQEELALLTPWKDKLAPEVFGPSPVPPVSDASGSLRPRMAEALALLKEAGWTPQDGALRNAAGEQLRFSLLLQSQSMQRVAAPFARNLERMGIRMDVETPDQTRFIALLRAFDYDMVHSGIRQSRSPGNEQRGYWSAAAKDAPGSRNYAGIADPVVDALIERLAEARDKAALAAAARALDRVLLHGAYVTPGYYSSALRVAWWPARVAMPERAPRDGLDMNTWYRGEENAGVPGGQSPGGAPRRESHGEKNP